MKISPAVLGALRTLGILVLVTVLSWLSNAANLQGVFSPVVVSVITILAGALEQSLSVKSGNTTALFGAVKTE